MNLPEIKNNIVVFDLEIKAVIDKVNVGWKDYHKMGVSVGCAYNYLTDDYSVYCDDNLLDLVEMINKCELLTGFNIIGFDIPLLEAEATKCLTSKTDKGISKPYHKELMDKMIAGQPLVTPKRIYDVLVEVRRAAGYKSTKEIGITAGYKPELIGISPSTAGFPPGGFTLDACLLNTFGASSMKTADGAEAPVMYLQGRLGELHSYCLADVKREKKLFEHVITGGIVRGGKPVSDYKLAGIESLFPIAKEIKLISEAIEIEEI
jgi:hypothetical protein